MNFKGEIGKFSLQLNVVSCWEQVVVVMVAYQEIQPLLTRS